MPDLAVVAIALAVLALAGVVALAVIVARLRERVRDLGFGLAYHDDRLMDLERFQANLSLGLVDEPRVHLPTPAGASRVAELRAIGHTEQHARDLAQAEALDDPPTLPAAVPADHSRPSQMPAFGRKA